MWITRREIVDNSVNRRKEIRFYPRFRYPDKNADIYATTAFMQSAAFVMRNRNVMSARGAMRVLQKFRF